MKKVILLHSFLLLSGFLFGLGGLFLSAGGANSSSAAISDRADAGFFYHSHLDRNSRPRVSRQCYGFCAHLSSRDLSAGCAVNSAIFIFKRLFLWFCSLLSVGPFALAAVISFALFPIVDCRCGSRCPFQQDAGTKSSQQSTAPIAAIYGWLCFSADIGAIAQLRGRSQQLSLFARTAGITVT